MAFTPFMQGKDAQSIINNYLGQNVSASTPMSPMDMNQYGVFRNPYSPTNFYANETDMYPAPTYTAPVIDNEGIPTCQAGYVYDEILKQCVHVGYGEPTQESGRTEDDPEERPYMSIEDMKNASNEDLIDYLKSGWLKNSAFGYLPSKGGNVTLGGNFMPPAFALAFGGQNDLRKNAIIAELSNRGYFTGEFDDKGQEIFDIVSTPNPNLGFNEAEVPYGGAGIINEGVTGSYGGGEDFGSYQGGGSSSNNINSTNNNNIVNYTGNEGQGTGQSGGGIANPHTNTGFSGGNPFSVDYETVYGADI